ncbi:MAG: hypothetical protein KGM43_15665 [Planctomycetota bacterium]|nr:hypothetical protein [Planctomycetota bacterium]
MRDEILPPITPAKLAAFRLDEGTTLELIQRRAKEEIKGVIEGTKKAANIAVTRGKRVIEVDFDDHVNEIKKWISEAK